MPKKKKPGGAVPPEPDPLRWLRYGLIVFALTVSFPAFAQAPVPAPSDRPSPQQPGVDPTENVKALSAAEAKRQDDLRAAEEKLFDSKLKSLNEISDLRHQLADTAIARLASEANIRADAADKLAIAEAKRIDAIRAVDVNAVQVANERATVAAGALAAQVTQSAEVLRNQVTASADALRTLVATTAATALQNEQQQFATLSTRIAALETSQSEGKGKQTITDPAFVALEEAVRRLVAAQSGLTGVGTGQGEMFAWALAGFMALIALATLLVTFMRRQLPARVPTPTP
jgi:hypothetical protein